MGEALSGDGRGACRATEWTEAKMETVMNLLLSLTAGPAGAPLPLALL